jgi:hypothetical protein
MFKFSNFRQSPVRTTDHIISSFEQINVDLKTRITRDLMEYS